MKRCYQKSREVSKSNKQKTPVQLPLTVEERVKLIRNGIHEFVISSALTIAALLLDDEVAQLCGARYERKEGKSYYRYGSQRGSIVAGGQRHAIDKPRVRSKKGGGEASLERYSLLNAEGAMPESVLMRLVRGVSCRDYEKAVDAAMNGYGVKKSSVSRSFVRASSEELRKVCERRFDGFRYAVIVIDGIKYAGEDMVVAMGITEGGDKNILGVRQGATENGTLVTELLEDISSRGVDASVSTLFILDGSKALSSAVKRVWGNKGVIQRCQVHKKRNVKDYLPASMQEEIIRRMNEAYSEEDYDRALSKLKKTATWLERINPSAASSLREGMEETLTVVRLGIKDELRKTLSSTNVIESAFSIVRNTTNRVKRWREGDMRLRWCAAGLLRAEKKFRRVKGYREIPSLITKLDSLVSEKSLDRNSDVA